MNEKWEDIGGRISNLELLTGASEKHMNYKLHTAVHKVCCWQIHDVTNVADIVHDTIAARRDEYA